MLSFLYQLPMLVPVFFAVMKEFVLQRGSLWRSQETAHE